MAEIPSSGETGSIGIQHLKRYWYKNHLRKNGRIKSSDFSDEWNLDQAVVNAVGIGLKPSLDYIYQQSESFEDFENWILKKNGGLIPADTVRSFNDAVSGNSVTGHSSENPVLTQADHDHFNEHGFVIVRNAVSREEAQASADAVWDFLGADPNDPSTWYKLREERSGIMVELFHHPALGKSRASEKIRKAFEELWGEGHCLFVTTDRVSFNPPETNHWKFQWPNLHWDVSIAQPVPFGLQGLLYLTDTSADQGAFNVIPGFHHSIGEWLKTVPENIPPRDFILERKDIHCIEAAAGDAIIWHHALPHGSKPNTAQSPRIVQYVNWHSLNRKTNPVWL